MITLWAPTLERSLISNAACGFLSQRDTLHAAQEMADLIKHSVQGGSELWLASFDVLKCFDSLPCWAVFSSLRHVGAPTATLHCFETFYVSVTQRFCYDSMDGSPGIQPTAWLRAAPPAWTS